MLPFIRLVYWLSVQAMDLICFFLHHFLEVFLDEMKLFVYPEMDYENSWNECICLV